ncbi:MAG TPA: vitamin B12 dependent-methionine synthase activation domain-containing protein, partial [Pseudobdellovibrionaceae bacterium]|nr:vitamin B12 dependent-methionine synthase activation domain-containing protein [Pseudobdellovibrionaceae bacterium]
DAQKMLQKIVSEKLFHPKSIVGIFPAHAQDEVVTLKVGEDKANGEEQTQSEVEVKTDVTTKADTITETFHFERQQRKAVVNNNIHYSLADFIAPASSGREDYMGLFVVSTGGEVEKLALKYEQQHDDYSAILVKALGDRFAEALAEWTHKKIRDSFGFGETENLSKEELIKEKYRGIRPAPGYPACPNHSQKLKIWKLLNAEERTGVRLTENFAMTPSASVCGYYFQHPQSKYFAI